MLRLPQQFVTVEAVEGSLLSVLRSVVAQTVDCTSPALTGPGKLNMIGFLTTSEIVAAVKCILAFLRVRRGDSY